MTFGLLSAEWTKIRSVRSTLWSLLAFMVVAIGFSALIIIVISNTWNSPGNHPNHVRLLEDPTAVLFGAGFGLGQLAIRVLGVIVMSSEYSTGAIRASLLAVFSGPYAGRQGGRVRPARPGCQRDHRVRGLLHHDRDHPQPRVDHAVRSPASPGRASAGSCTRPSSAFSRWRSVA